MSKPWPQFGFSVSVKCCSLGLKSCGLGLSFADRTNIHRHQTLPWYRHALHGLHPSASRPLRPNVTSSIKPEVRNVTPLLEDRAMPIGDPHTKFHANRSSSSRDMLTDRQRQTHKQTGWSQFSAPLPRGGVIIGLDSFDQSALTWLTVNLLPWIPSSRVLLFNNARRYFHIFFMIWLVPHYQILCLKLLSFVSAVMLRN